MIDIMVAVRLCAQGENIDRIPAHKTVGETAGDASYTGTQTDGMSDREY